MGLYSENHHVEDLILSAVNYGGHFYEAHKRLGRNGASVEAWAAHVRRAIIPEWRRGGGHRTFARAEVAEAATALRRYYIEHVAECARCDAESTA